MTGGEDVQEQKNIYQILGELTAEVRGLRRDVQDDRAASSEHRQVMREEIQKLVLRVTHVEVQTTSLSQTVENMKKVTDDVQTLTAKAVGAGLLGHWLVKIGIGVVTFGGWLYAAYAWISGRPPP